MYLTREQVAHVTGMTPVHASRMWSELVSKGLISCAGHQVTIRAEECLAGLAHYCDRDSDFDFAWLRFVDAGEHAWTRRQYVVSKPAHLADAIMGKGVR